jgi:hypothetical protein
MHLIQKIKKRSVARNTTIVFVAIMLGAVVTDAIAAGRGGGADFTGGHTSPGFNEPLPDSVPSAPAPIFNPSSPYTVSPSPETPVSPASPGSVLVSAKTSYRS